MIIFFGHKTLQKETLSCNSLLYEYFRIHWSIYFINDCISRSTLPLLTWAQVYSFPRICHISTVKIIPPYSLFSINWKKFILCHGSMRSMPLSQLLFVWHTLAYSVLFLTASPGTAVLKVALSLDNSVTFFQILVIFKDVMSLKHFMICFEIFRHVQKYLDIV